MTTWDKFSPADFDASRDDKRAAKCAKAAAETGQAGLFFVPTPEREASKPAAPEMDGQDSLWPAETR